MKRYDKRIRKGKEKCAKIICTFLCISFVGIACSKMETTDTVVETKAETVEVATETVEITESEYMIDVREIVSFEETETGMLLHLKDGTGCYVENAENVTQYVHVISEVVYSYGDTVDDIYKTNLICAMPDGSLHNYTIQDPPEGNVEFVCLETINQEKYESYEIVGAIETK